VLVSVQYAGQKGTKEISSLLTCVLDDH